MDVDEALAVAKSLASTDTSTRVVSAAHVLAAEVVRLRELHSPETAEVEDENGITTATYCGHDGHPWPCPSIEGRA